jgi:hypothetical protein
MFILKDILFKRSTHVVTGMKERIPVTVFNCDLSLFHCFLLKAQFYTFKHKNMAKDFFMYQELSTRLKNNSHEN